MFPFHHPHHYFHHHHDPWAHFLPLLSPPLPENKIYSTKNIYRLSTTFYNSDINTSSSDPPHSSGQEKSISLHNSL